MTSKINFRHGGRKCYLYVIKGEVPVEKLVHGLMKIVLNMSLEISKAKIPVKRS